MKNEKGLLFGLLALGILTWTGCDKEEHDHHDHNDITIHILKPSPDEVVADPSNVEIHIEFEATEGLEEIEIVLYAHEEHENKIIDFDIHTHENTYEFREEADLSSYPSGTEFHLEVSVCEDHDCTESIHKHLNFSLQ